LFVWGALSHMVFQLGDVGIQSLPGEEAIFPALRGAIQQPGFYFFPGIDQAAIRKLPKEQADAATAKWTEKWKAGPRGVLIVHPEATPNDPMTAGTLGRQLGIDVVACLLVAFLMSQLSTRTRYSCRVGVATTIGFLTG